MMRVVQTPLHTPREIIARVNHEFAAAPKLPAVQEQLFAVVAEATHTSPAAFGVFLQ